MNKSKIIFVAVDTNNINKAKKIIRETKTNKLNIAYKFGLEFLHSKKGRLFISKLKKKIIFIDAKFCDIPKTMASATKVIKDLKPNYLTVHISSGPEALKAVKKVSGNIKILGVTTLTSLDNDALKKIGYKKNVNQLVLHQAKLAKNLDGIICSPKEASFLKNKLKGLDIITPGIRLPGQSSNDQKRVLTPKDALKHSAGIVIGRSLTTGNIKKNLKKLINHLNN